MVRILVLGFVVAVALPLAGGRAQGADVLIPTGAAWRYLDDGSNQGTDWIVPAFNDTGWSNGVAQLGYGEGDEATVIGFGGTNNNRHVTYYFRHAFTNTSAQPYLVATLRVKRDDGVVVYLNGREVFRDGFPAGEVLYSQFASNAGDDGQTFLQVSIPATNIVSGRNVLAAEVHQSAPSSSDVSFDLELTASAQNSPPAVALISPSEGTSYTEPATIILTASASDSDGSVALVEFFRGATKLGEDGASPFTFEWAGVTVGNYALRAIATDNLGAKATSAVVNVRVDLPTPPVIVARSPAAATVSNLTTITVSFSEPVVGVDAEDLLVNGVPARSVAGARAGTNYVFTIEPPEPGTVYVAWRGTHGIADFESPPKPFDPHGVGATWQYTLVDTVPPVLVRVDPPAGATVNQLARIEVKFSEAVSGVDAADLRINGVPASSVTGGGDGPYVFEFVPPANGAVTVSWLAGHGIRDLSAARNAFAGGSWAYTLNTNAVWDGQVIISEVMFHPSSELVADEWIELHNRGASSVNLAGWRLSRAIEFTFPAVSLPAGGYLVVAADPVAFDAKYPSVSAVVGGWAGRLSNSRDEIELEDASGERVDLVEYADQGDWAVRTWTSLGWDWVSPADGLGRTLELRQLALPNGPGQNWAASQVAEGTPGAVNSVATNNLAPMILDVSHLPAVPRSTNTVTVLARIVDESTAGLTVRLWRRDAGVTTLEAFTNVVMRDNGLSNDGAAGDGLFGVVLPAMANGTINEFFVEAVDAAGNVRTWPAPADMGGGVPGQEANAFFQVDDEVYAGSQPLHRIIMRAQDRADFFNQFDRVQRNATFVTVDAGDVEIRHGCAARRRGASSFGSTPPTMKFDIPRDRLWKDKSSLNLNSVNTYAQVLGAAVALQAELPAPYTRAVQLRFNGVNQSPPGGGMFGSYAEVEVANGEWARDHVPNDPNGNVYSKRRPECGLEYLGTDPQPYINCAFDKESNASENDWTDLMALTFALDPDTTPANLYVQAVQANVNVELWLRYFAVLFLMNYNETALSNGADDDYDLYRGVEDPRFMVLPHDFDSIFGSAGSTADDLFLGARIPNIARFLRHPTFEPLYYSEYRRQLAGAFATNNLFPLMDQVLGDWVPAATINGMKANAAARIAYVQGALPVAPVAVRATVSGEPDSPAYQTTATLTVGGADITQYRFRVNNGAWSADRAVAQPITLSGLTNGHYTVYVVGRDSVGNWQGDADATISRTWAVLSSLRGVVLSEVLARNDGAVVHEGTTPDFIELFNAGTGTVDLSGYRLTDDLDDPDRYLIPAGTTISPGGFRVLFANGADGTSGLHTGFGLDGAGDRVYLLDRATNGVRVIDSIRFGAQLSNRSVARLPNGRWGLAVPTLGAANTAAAVGTGATLKINEWLASPGGLFTEDFVELYNPDSLPVNVGGLSLTDRPLGDPDRHEITPLTFVDGFGYLAFIASGDRTSGPQHLDFSLSGEGGEIGLLSESGVRIDSVVYGTQVAGFSQGRSPNGGSRIVFFEVPTPGAGNPVAPAPVEPQVVNLVPFSQVWRFNQDTNLDGVAWQAAAFNDTGWSNGAALFGAPVPGGAPVPVTTPLTLGGGRITYYFRTTFSMPNGVVPTSLQLSNIIDDGAIFYLNGQEIYRVNLPAGQVTNATFATTVSGAPGWTGPIQLPATNVVAGVNVLAVELHQGSLTSSDVYFGSRLDALIVTNNPALAGLKINEVMANAFNSTNADGTVSDWVEVHNPSPTVVDLGGMSFTDQVATPRRWVFPTGTLIPAGGYRLVRFDPDRPATTNVAASLNAGFGLKASGDSLYLFNRPQSGGELIDAISFGVQAPDWTIGRVPNGGSNWVLTVPSPTSGNLAAALGNPGQLRINEWMAAPASGPDWFELYNPGAQPVEISGLHLTDDLNNRLQYPPFPARSYMAAGLTGFLQIFADNDPAAGPDHVPFALGRNGESLGICDRFGTLIDQYTFGAQLTGVSQGRLPDGGTNIVSFPETATPEESNYLPIPNVVINEVLSHTDLPLEDAIELRNTSGAQVNVGGWYLSDARTALRKYRIPNNTFISANGFRVFYEYQFNPVPNDPGSFSLSSAKGDEVYLSAADGQGVLTGYRAVVSFGASANGVSFGRHVTSVQNGSKVDFTAMAQRTFGNDSPPTVDDFRAGSGLANSAPKVGPVVVSEIHYHPVDLAGGLDNLNDEFIELQNITASPVPLYDPGARTNTWRLRDAVSFTFPTNVVIPANGVIVVVGFNPSDAALSNAFRTKFSLQAGAVLLGPWNGKLDNGTDSVELVRPDPPQTVGPDAGLVPEILVDKVKYFDTAPWPLAADGSGQSLTRVTPGNYGNDVVNWAAATPTPGPQGASQDTDGDGMPNAWETQYGLNPNVNDAAGDLDGDGLRNLDEYLAGTAPNNPSSVLRVAIAPGSPAVLQFNAASNLTYTVEFKGALVSGAWSTLQSVPAGNARSVQINLPTVSTNRFYRVRTP